MAKYHPVFIFFRLIVSTACILHRVTSTNTTRCPSYWSSRCLPVLQALHHVITVFVTQCVRSPSTITSIYHPQAHFVNCLYLTQGYTKTTKTTTTNILIISVSVCTTYITSSLCVSGLHHQASSPSIYYPKAYCAHCLYPTQGYISKYSSMSITLIITVSSPSIHYPEAYCAHCLYLTQGSINKYNSMSIILIISVSSPGFHHPEVLCALILYHTHGHIKKYNPMSTILIISVSACTTYTITICIIQGATSKNSTRYGSLGSLLVERRTHDRKVASSNPGRSGGRIFFSRVNSVCWLLFDVHSTPVLPQ